MPPYSIGERVFPTKDKAKRFVREWLEERPQGYVCQHEDMEKWIIPLFKQHPQFDEKMDQWNGRISVRRDMAYNCFYIEKDHPHQTCSISVNVCFDSKRADKKADVQAAFRSAIQEQIFAFRLKLFADKDQTPICCFTGRVLLNDQNTHIDHDERFIELFNAFCAQNRLITDSIPIKKIKWSTVYRRECLPGERADYIKNEIDDIDIENKWKEFHAKHAKLQAVHKTWNLRNNQKSKQKQTIVINVK